MKLLKTAVLILALACVSQAQTIVTQFDGVTGNGSGSPNVPRPTVASNGTQLLETTGQDFLYLSTAGATLSTRSEATFLAAVSPSISCTLPLDPRGYFIPSSIGYGRWIVVQSCSSGDWLIVSSGSDITTATWKAVALGGALGANGDLTMRIGYDVNGVYISENDPVHSTKYTLYGIPKADILWSGGGAPSISNMQTWTQRNFELACAPDLNASKVLTAPVFCPSVSNPNAGANTAFNLQIDQFTWPGGGVGGACTDGVGASPCSSMASVQTFVTGYKHNTPVDEPQPSSGASIKGSETKHMQQSFESGTHLYTVFGDGPCASSCGTQGVDSHNLFFWWDVNISVPATLTIAQTAKVSSASLTYDFPQIVADASGNMLLMASAVSSGTNASIYSWYRLTTDTANTLHGPTVVTTGTQVYNCSAANPVSWGTYMLGAQDPTDTTMLWAVAEYGGSASSCVWKTRIAELQLATPPSAPTQTGNFSSVQIWGAVQ